VIHFSSLRLAGSPHWHFEIRTLMALQLDFRTTASLGLRWPPRPKELVSQFNCFSCMPFWLTMAFQTSLGVASLQTNKLRGLLCRLSRTSYLWFRTGRFEPPG
jgi:hypothetical protein